MLNLDITKLAAAWGKAPLKADPYQCLPLRSPKSKCRLCVENCPVAAIEIKQDSIKVADNACTGCGACFNLCPTGVFEMTNFEPETFAEKAVSRNKTIKIECYKVPLEHSTSLRLPCLAHITQGLIFTLLSTGADEVTIRDAGICEVCESKYGDRIAKDTVSKTQELLECLGLTQKASIIAEGVPINSLVHEGGRLKDYKDEPDLSRREVFSLLKREAKKGIANIIKDKTPLKIEGKEKLKKVLPKQRESLLMAIEAFGDKVLQKPVNTPLFPAISINNGCNMCGLCALFCPTDALSITETEEANGIVFKAATCVGCNLCADVCAEKAVTLNEKEISMEDIIKRKETTAIRFDKAPCADCGKDFVKINSKNLCGACLKEREIF